MSFLNKLISLSGALNKNGSYVEASIVDLIIKKASIYKISFVRRRGNKWVVVSRKGKLLGTHPTKEEALAQLRAIESNK